MKNVLIFLLMLGFNFITKAQNFTKIYLVRHAEKVTTDSANKDPLLTEKGQKRALALAKKLKKQKLSAIYCTDYQRTKLTAQPTAEKQNLNLQSYNPSKLQAFAKKVLQDNNGKKVLIVGHSNTVLETIEALGGKSPIAAISDNEYDYFFTVKISAEGFMEVDFERYGEKNKEVVKSHEMKLN